MIQKEGTQDEFILSTGRTLSNCTYLSIDPEDDSIRNDYGDPTQVNYEDEEGNEVEDQELTTEEKSEIAQFMIQRWSKLVTSPVYY